MLEGCRAAGVLVEPGVEAPHLSLVVVDHPYVALAKVLAFFDRRPRPAPGVDPRSALDPGLRSGPGRERGPLRVGGTRVPDRRPGRADGGGDPGPRCVDRRGRGSAPSVTIYDGCVIGARSVIHAGTVVGSDGFGYAQEGGSTSRSRSWATWSSRRTWRSARTSPWIGPPSAAPGSGRGPRSTTSSRWATTATWARTASWWPRWASPGASAWGGGWSSRDSRAWWAMSLSGTAPGSAPSRPSRATSRRARSSSGTRPGTTGNGKRPRPSWPASPR